MGRALRVIGWVITLPVKLVVGICVAAYGVGYALWVIASTAFTSWRNGDSGASEEEVLAPEDFEDEEPPTTEPLSRSLDMLLESMEEIRIIPQVPLAKWYAERRVKRQGQ